METWKDIKGYENLYQVSDLGNVKNIKTGRILKQKIDNGYYRIGFSFNGKVKMFRVHRLVAEAFLPNPKNYKIVNHIDRNRKNNNVSNLEWCDNIHNVTHKLDMLFKNKELFNKLCLNCRTILNNLYSNDL